MVLIPSGSIASFLSLLLLLNLTLALQVTSNSPCASVCLDNSANDVSDPASSNTRASDVVCLDKAYSTTEVGKKYQACVSCLQNSTSASSGENDQEWFLYNLRYTLSSCLFNFANATDRVSTPCSTSESCGHLQNALESHDLDPTVRSPYSYCSDDSNAFLGSYHDKCSSCLENSGDEKYLANFMVALRAGCTQRPSAGMLIGLDGTVFSKSPVNITFPGDTHERKRNGLSKGGIIGISVSAALFLLMLSAALFVCYRKYWDQKRLKKLGSPLDSRFGAPNITSPNTGAYGNLNAAPAVKLSQPFDASSLSLKERQVLGLQRPVGAMHISTTSYPHPKAWESTRQPPNNRLPPYSPPGMPTHQAYISNVPAVVPESPVTSIASSGTYQVSPYQSPKSSPTYLPASTPSTQSSHGAPLSSTQSLKSPQNRHLPPSKTYYTSPRPSPHPFPSQPSTPQSHTEYTSPRPSPHPSPPQPSPSQVQSIQTRLEPRSHPRMSARRVITKFTSSGSANTASGFSSPVQISAPMVNHGPGFDYETREQDERDQHGRRRIPETPTRIETPQSAESAEQWPGSY